MNLSIFKKIFKYYLVFIISLFVNIVSTDDSTKPYFLNSEQFSSEDIIYIDTNNYDNLWSIGIEIKESLDQFSVYQIMISILESNEDAFSKLNINYLSKGYILEVSLRKIAEYDPFNSIRETAKQNLEANIKPVDYSYLKDVLVLSEPDTFLLNSTDNPFNISEDLSRNEPNIVLDTNQIIKNDIPAFEIESNNLVRLEKNLKTNIENKNLMDSYVYLIITLGILFLIFLFLRTRSSELEESTKGDEELDEVLDEEFGEIGNPIQARINLAITYIEMTDSDKAKKLLDKVLESNPNSLQKEQALSLLKKID
jgi:FimV-like protein|tara:strand:- start:1589 stop:2521 length:933 start_codon:yes stop_codon:yes gene_type:complete